MSIEQDLNNLSLKKVASNTSTMSFTKDYISNPFSGKQQQFDQVLDILDQTGFIPENLIESETKWFYNHLGIDDVFFARESAQGIANHIHSLYSCKIQAFAKVTGKLIYYRNEADDHAVYFSSQSVSDDAKENFEEFIDEKYLDPSSSASVSYRAEFYQSKLDPSSDVLLSGIYEKNPKLGKQVIKCYFVYKTKYTTENHNENNVNSTGDVTFLKISSPNTKKLYQDIIDNVILTTGPVIKHYPVQDSEEFRVIIGFRQKLAPHYNSALTDLLNYYKLSLTRKYVEQFSNGITIISMYINSNNYAPVNLSIYQVIKEASLLYSIPRNYFHDLFVNGKLSIQESIYAHCGVIFVTHFLNRLGPEYNKLSSLLDASKSIQHAEVLNSLKKRLRSETYTQNFIQEVFQARIEIIKKLYRNFADIHYVRLTMEKTLSYQRISQITPFANDAEFETLLNRECSQNNHHILVLRALYTFNKAILKTNFYMSTKVALSFRLKPTFLPKTEYPETPFGMFFIVGSEFRGFHIRFRDIARGGIRIVQSRSVDNYNVNIRNLFDENYNLASTQQRKNKDIPEGGSKGVLLLDPGAAQNRPQANFEKYVDSLIDLLLKQNIPGVKDTYVDLYNKPEILFLGPDEGTAGFVDWATLHAKSRGAPWWKSFTTGKNPEIGGIPHDVYGMTSLSVRAYVNKIYQKLGIDNSTIKKLQTGGPDGDLGSNEILLSRNENYVGIVDGSGVIGDPNGLDKEELKRLAKERLMIDHYDKSKLSPLGFVILVDDVDRTLPNGYVVTSGIAFRNTFHLKVGEVYGLDVVDLFVPCGGRPAAIDTDNVAELINQKNGKSIIPYIVEGANLFITQPAKMILEKAGCVIFRDASTNKGGVTSSSLEVLAALSFDDASFAEKMCIQDGKVPKFYQEYVKAVQQIVVNNAESEFESLWSLKNDETTFTELSDKLSSAINKLSDELANSNELWNDDTEFRVAVLLDSLPDLLVKEVGLKNILQRVPEPYLKALFACRLASRFVYSRGIESNPARFLEFILSIRREYKDKGYL